MRGAGMTEWIVGVQYRAPEAVSQLAERRLRFDEIVNQ
jgi:hypothetical protein